jgi:hypothetical protein
MDKVILTAEQAEEMLLDGKYVHNFVNPSTNMLVGCDYERADAIAAFKKALQIELGGEQCMRMKHPLVVWDSKTHCSFFEADMAKVEAFELAKTKAA